MASVTVQTVANAIRKNGYEQAFGTFVQREGKKVVAACALGQAGLNLGVKGEDLSGALGLIENEDGATLSSTIIGWNDNDHLKLHQIAARIEHEWADYLDEVVDV